MDRDPKKSRHWPDPEVPPKEENPFLRETKPEQRAVDIPPRARPHDQSLTLMAVEEAFAKRLREFGSNLRDDMRVKDQRMERKLDALNEKVETLSTRLDDVESGTDSARRDSSASLEKSREAAQLVIQLRRTLEMQKQLHEKLEQAPESQVTIDKLLEASDLASKEAREKLVKTIKRWMTIGAAVMGLVAGAASWLSSHRTAKEAAKEAVQESQPKVPQLPPGWVVIQPATTVAPAPTQAPGDVP